MRVRLQNFLTYHDVEFSPGPRLNVVVGPNGTGKSTILCAVCLGLGGQPTLLGRADDARLFITHEKNRATVEIELAPARGETRGHVFRRVIDRAKGSERGRGLGASSYFVNGESSSAKRVREIVTEVYGVAVDNMCTFLPQDRVGSFSGVTPTDLLVETEKAVGVEAVYKPHVELQKLESEVLSEGNEFGSMKKRLEDLRAENERLERQKTMMEERKRAQERGEKLKMKKAWLLFDAARIRACEMKELKLEKVTLLKKAREELQPLREKAVFLRNEANRVISLTQTLDKQEKKAVKDHDAAMDKHNNYAERLEVHLSNYNGIETRRRKARRNIEKAAQRLNEAQQHMESLPPPDRVDTDVRKAQTDVREAKRHLEAAKRGLQEVTNVAREAEDNVKTKRGKLERMKDDKRQRQERLFRIEARVGKMYEWLDANRKMFRRPVWGPVARELTMKSANAAAYLENHCKNTVLKSFVVECREDFNLLYRELREKRDLPVQILTVPNGRLQPITRTYSDNKFAVLKREHGVLGWLDESFEAPDAVRQALIEASSVHAVLVGTEKTQDSLDRRNLLDYLGQREDDRRGLLNSCVFTCQGNKSFKYVSMVSRYSGKTSLRVDEITPARLLAPGVDPRQKERLERELEDDERALEASRPERDRLQRTHDDVLEEGQALAAKLREARAVRNELDNARARLEAAERRVSVTREEANADYEQERRETLQQLRNCVALSVEQLERASVVAGRVANAARESAGVRMTSDGLDARAQRCADALVDRQAETEHLEREASEVSDRFQEAKKEARNLKAEAGRVAPIEDAAGKDLPLKAEMEKLPESLDEVEAALDEVAAVVDSITDNPEVLRRYEARKREIAETEAEIEQISSAHGRRVSEMERLVNDWKSRLLNTVARVDELFGKYMEELGCAGEVRLRDASVTDTDDATGEKNTTYNFGKWGIEIRVKFREKSSLQVLSAQVQSGGERSVSTIMYLMALQELMASPFRCVDEINQGLDERNERLVFRRIVDNSTRPVPPGGRPDDHCGQYFLITPKLLPNLTDMENENVTVLCIFNGAYSFNHYSEWNVDSFLGAAAAAATEEEYANGDENGDAMVEEEQQEAPVPKKRKSRRVEEEETEADVQENVQEEEEEEEAPSPKKRRSRRRK